MSKNNKDEVAGKKIEGEIYFYVRDKFDKTQVYTTEKFIITATCERERVRVITNITIEEKE